MLPTFSKTGVLRGLARFSTSWKEERPLSQLYIYWIDWQGVTEMVWDRLAGCDRDGMG